MYIIGLIWGIQNYKAILYQPSYMKIGTPLDIRIYRSMIEFASKIDIIFGMHMCAKLLVNPKWLCILNELGI